MALKGKMALFVAEYLKDLNGTQAVIRAGYSKKTANAQAGKLLMRPDIQEAIAKGKAKRVERIEVDSDYVLKRLWEIDQLDVLDILHEDGAIRPLNQWPKAWRTSISALDISEIFAAGEQVGENKKIKWPDKVKNLELIGKHVNVNAFKEQTEVKTTIDGEVKVNVRDMTQEERIARINELVKKVTK